MDPGADSGANGRWFSVYAAGRWNPKSAHVSLPASSAALPPFPLGCLQFSGSPGRSPELRLVQRWRIESVSSGGRALTILKKKTCFLREGSTLRRVRVDALFSSFFLYFFPFAASCKLALFPLFCRRGSRQPLPLRRPAVSFPASACRSQVILTRIRLRALFIYSIYVN